MEPQEPCFISCIQFVKLKIYKGGKREAWTWPVEHVPAPATLFSRGGTLPDKAIDWGVMSVTPPGCVCVRVTNMPAISTHLQLIVGKVVDTETPLLSSWFTVEWNPLWTSVWSKETRMT